MSVHLIKMAVGVESVGHLAGLQEARLRRAAEAGAEPALHHFTRHTPRRADELCDGGSLYWVIRGFVSARQRLLACERRRDAEGRPRCALVLDPRLVRTYPRAHRPFQGWRYLAQEKAPPDTAPIAADGEEMPDELADELRLLGLL